MPLDPLPTLCPAWIPCGFRLCESAVPNEGSSGFNPPVLGMYHFAGCQPDAGRIAAKKHNVRKEIVTHPHSIPWSEAVQLGLRVPVSTFLTTLEMTAPIGNATNTMVGERTCKRLLCFQRDNFYQPHGTLWYSRKVDTGGKQKPVQSISSFRLAQLLLLRSQQLWSEMSHIANFFPNHYIPAIGQYMGWRHKTPVKMVLTPATQWVGLLYVT